MNRERQQDDSQDDDNAVGPDALKPTCEGMADIPGPIDDNHDQEVGSERTH
jgi:hypothetical protein